MKVSEAGRAYLRTWVSPRWCGLFRCYTRQGGMRAGLTRVQGESSRLRSSQPDSPGRGQHKMRVAPSGEIETGTPPGIDRRRLVISPGLLRAQRRTG